jgi:hypothetical protein
MPCGKTYDELRADLEDWSKRLDERQRTLAALDKDAHRHDRAKLLREIGKADRERHAAIEAWRSHLREPLELKIVRDQADHLTARYGRTSRTLAATAFRSEAAVRARARDLWEMEHARPDLEDCAEPWEQARTDATAALSTEINAQLSRL